MPQNELYKFHYNDREDEYTCQNTAEQSECSRRRDVEQLLSNAVLAETLHHRVFSTAANKQVGLEGQGTVSPGNEHQNELKCSAPHAFTAM